MTLVFACFQIARGEIDDGEDNAKDAVTLTVPEA